MKRHNLVIWVFVLPFAIAYCQEQKNEASYYISQGMTAYSAGDFKPAIESFKKAFLLRPDYSALAYNISACYALQGETDSAIAWLQKTFELGSYSFQNDTDFVSLHADVRYQRLVQDAEMRIKELKDKEWKPIIRLPAQYAEDKIYPVVIGLHGYGMNPVDLAKSVEPAFLEAGYLLCCPYGPDVRGTTDFAWGEYADAEARILETVQFLRENYKIGGAKIVLFGFSQGGEMAFFSGLKHPEIFSAIISAAGYYSEEMNQLLDREEAGKIAVYMMIGENDDQVDTNRLAEQLMQSKGMRVKLVIYKDVGHAFPPNSRDEIRKALQWVEGVN